MIIYDKLILLIIGVLIAGIILNTKKITYYLSFGLIFLLIVNLSGNETIRILLGFPGLILILTSIKSTFNGKKKLF